MIVRCKTTMLGRCLRTLLALLGAAVCLVGAKPKLRIAFAGNTKSDFGVQEVMHGWIAVQYWKTGPSNLGGSLVQPAVKADFDIEPIFLNTLGESRPTFERCIGLFASNRPSAVVGAMSTLPSQAISRFCTIYSMPHLTTANNDLKIEDKTNFPFAFRSAHAVTADADVASVLLKYFGFKYHTVVYFDYVPNVDRLDRLKSLMTAGGSPFSAQITRIPDSRILAEDRSGVDWTIVFGWVVLFAQQLVSKRNWVIVNFLSSGCCSENQILISVIYAMPILENVLSSIIGNGHALHIYNEACLRAMSFYFLSWKAWYPMVNPHYSQSMAGGMFGNPMPSQTAWPAFKTWAAANIAADRCKALDDTTGIPTMFPKTSCTVSRFADEGFLGPDRVAEGNYPGAFLLPVYFTPTWGLADWYCHSFDMTYLVIHAANSLFLEAAAAVPPVAHPENDPTFPLQLFERIKITSLDGIYGKVEWTPTLARQNLVFSIIQLRSTCSPLCELKDEATMDPGELPEFIPIGQVGLYSNSDGTSSILMDSSAIIQPPFRKIGEAVDESPKQILGPDYLAPACVPGSAKPEKYGVTLDYVTLTLCAPCAAGKYSREDSLFQCVDCLPGEYAKYEGTSRCSQCPPGNYSESRGSTKCTQCGAGNVSRIPGNPLCEHCVLGKYARGRGNSECSICAAGSYSVTEGATDCLSCPAGTTTENFGADAKEKCVCKADSYAPLGVVDTCTVCKEGMVCALGSKEEFIPTSKADASGGPHPIPREGYYTTYAEPLSVYLCPIAKICPGGASEVCGTDLEGLVCAKCIPKHYKEDGECYKCQDMHRSYVLLPTIPVFITPVVILIMYKMSRDGVEKWNNAGNSCSAVFYLVLIYMQSLSMIRRCDIDYPGPTKTSWFWVAYLVDLMALLYPDCIGVTDFSTQFVLRMLSPLFILMYFVTTFVLARIFYKLFRKFWFNMRFDVVFTCYGSIIYSFYISVAQIAVSLFQCYPHPNDESSLVGYPEILCGSDDWANMLVVGLIGMMFYCVCTLAVIIHILISAPRRFADEVFQMRWKFLFIKFRADIWWWAIVVLAKNLLLNFATIIGDSGFAQIFWLIIVMLFYLCACFVFAPWRSFTAQAVDTAMHVNLLFTCVLSSQFTRKDQIDQEDLGLFVAFQSYAPCLLMGAGIIYLLFRRLQPLPSESHRADAQLICRTMHQAAEEDIMKDVLNSLAYIDYHRVRQVELILRTDVLREKPRNCMEQRLSYNTAASKTKDVSRRNSLDGDKAALKTHVFEELPPEPKGKGLPSSSVPEGSYER